MSGSEYTTTPNLGLYKPLYNADAEQWGNHLNANADMLDATAGSTINVLAFGASGDGVTNDTDAIQAALDANTGKATVFLPDTGNAYVCTGLTIPSNTDLLLFGTLKAPPSAPTHVVNLIPGHARIVIRGYGTIDANKAGQPPGNLIACINGSSDYVSISGITLQNSNVWNMNITASHHVRVDNVTMMNGTAANEFAAGCDDCWLTRCYIDGVLEDEGFSFYGGVTNSGAIGNVITNAGADGINVLCDGPQPTPCANITIADNICHGNQQAGIGVTRGAGGTGTHTGIIISNNRCYGNNRIGGATGSEIYVNYISVGLISGNMVSDDGVSACAYGILVGGAPGIDYTVSDNKIFNIGSAARPGSGLHVDSPNIMLATGNSFFDSRTPRYMTGITGAAGLVNVYTNNLFAQLVAPITLTPQPDTVIANAVDGRWTMTNLPTSATGLTTGNVWRNGTVLNII